MDPKVCFLDKVRSQNSEHHGDNKLRAEAIKIYGKCTEEQKEWLKSDALSSEDLRKVFNFKKNENKQKKGEIRFYMRLVVYGLFMRFSGSGTL